MQIEGGVDRDDRHAEASQRPDGACAAAENRAHTQKTAAGCGMGRTEPPGEIEGGSDKAPRYQADKHLGIRRAPFDAAVGPSRHGQTRGGSE